MALDKFKLSPKGNVQISLSWGSKKIDFQSGKYQILRKRIYAKKSYQFTVSGLTKDLEWLTSFYNSHYGQLKPFLFEYDGNVETVYFGGSLQLEVKREVGKIVGFSASITLDLDHRTATTSKALESDVLPRASGNISKTIDWNTKIYTSSSTTRRKERNTPETKLSANFKGSKKERDKIIALYESHEMIPLLFYYNNEKIKVRFPDSITLTDYREIKNIVGYSCDMDLEVVDNV